MISEVRAYAKKTVLYQRVNARRFMPITMGRYNELSNEEKTRLRICPYVHDKTKQIIAMTKSVKINIRQNERFQTWIDTGLVFPSYNRVIDNISPDYSLIIHHSINDLKRMYSNGSEVGKTNIIVLNAISNYIDRIVARISEKCTKNPTDNYLKNSLKYFERMNYTEAENLEEALQRILFWSSLFWQSGHRLIGLGRLDVILNQYSGKIPQNDLDNLLVDFIDAVHKYFPYKSDKVAQGDTGQIIILGGKCIDGSYFCNDITYSFIRCFMKHRLPDPKLLLRVSSDMPMDLFNLAIKTIGTGVGCPLLSNDEVIIPALMKFGYSNEDAFNYVTSACWEPVAYGKSLEQNNLYNINFAEALTETYIDEKFDSCLSFDDVMNLFLSKLDDQIENIKRKLDRIIWEKDPLMTLFTKGCYENGKDISEGGAIYNDYGILSVGLGNAVNSLMNIKKFFLNGMYTLKNLKNAARNNYVNFELIYKDLKTSSYFGKDEEDVIELVRVISDKVCDSIIHYRNRFGGKVKWGLSSPAYIGKGKRTLATLDGRLNYEPLMVHISSYNANSYTELVNFASRLDYTGIKSNGNVVDFFVSPLLFSENFEKFVAFVKIGIKQGFFQMQMNVIDSKVLIAAKEHPEKYPNLIVRVWGFSAYFNDLPDDYKNFMIERALKSEGVA